MRRETVGFLVFLAFFVSIVVITFESGGDDFFFPSEKEVKSILSVYIYGCVVKPGEYQVREGTTVKELQGLVRLKEDGEGNVFLKSGKVKEGDVIFVPKRNLGAKEAKNTRETRFFFFSCCG